MFISRADDSFEISSNGSDGVAVDSQSLIFYSSLWSWGDTVTDRSNNLDLIRLLAAASVIFSHAFLFADGSEAREPFIGPLGAILGIYGVYVFFILSGYLVTASMERSDGVLDYLWKRFLRIYPGLVACSAVFAFVVAPFFSALGTLEYLGSLEPEWYVVKIAALRIDAAIDTVTFFFEQPDWLGRAINGPLWTVLQEIFCYLLVAILWLLRAFNVRVAAVLFLVGTALQWSVLETPLWDDAAEWEANFCYALAPFSAGMLLYFASRGRSPSGPVALVGVAALAVAWFLGVFQVAFALPAAAVLWYLAFSPRLRLWNGARLGDMSYGTYLYGWPVLLVLRASLGPGFDPYLLALLAVPSAMACGLASWHLVEKRALALKSLRLVKAGGLWRAP